VPETKSSFDRSVSNGFRCMKQISTAEAQEKTFQSVPISSRRDFINAKPVSDEIFNIYKSLYSYDNTELRSIVEAVDLASPHWIKERITFNAAYGNERMIAYLFLPKNNDPPYQTVVYYPGAAAFYLKSSDKLSFLEDTGDRFDSYTDFVIKSGRALLYPIYKSTYERNDGFSLATSTWNSWIEHFVFWTKDFQRSIDYLETRTEIDHSKLAYYGLSSGAALGPIFLALEDRIKVGVLEAGGFEPVIGPQEINQLNYAVRVKAPILMINGKHDYWYTLEESIMPMYRFLGTPKEHKHLVLFDSGHDIPNRNKVMKEILDWLDRYLGPVNQY
jgi:dienelactone hydrolase